MKKLRLYLRISVKRDTDPAVYKEILVKFEDKIPIFHVQKEISRFVFRVKKKAGWGGGNITPPPKR